MTLKRALGIIRDSGHNGVTHDCLLALHVGLGTINTLLKTGFITKREITMANPPGLKVTYYFAKEGTQ